MRRFVLFLPLLLLAAGCLNGTETSATPKTVVGKVAAPAGPSGAALFQAQGCSACHTFKPAGATGTTGPDLDNVAADAAKAGRGTLAAYIAESIKDPSAYVVPKFPDHVMPAFTSLSQPEVDALVAYLAPGAKS